VQLLKDDPNAFRTIGDLRGADRIMNEAIFLGVYPGLTRSMLDYVIDTVSRFVRSQ
jgi:CDP-6-deoxy-D-xylo-4-hexulose-3-dehydrase